MRRHLGPWAGRAALICVGILTALAMLEGLLRLGGVLYELRPAVQSDLQLANSDNYRELCLGESTTAGLAWGDRAYPNQLERILNERAGGRMTFTVINGGKVATTTDVIVAHLPAMLDKFDPHVVVTMMGVNDGNAIDPSFQVGGTFRVWKLLRMLYNQYRTPTESDDVEDLLPRAWATMKHWPDVAIGMAERIIQTKPDDPRGYLILAEAQVRQKKVGRAAEAFLKALEVDGPAVVAYSFEADDQLIAILDGTLGRVETKSDALAARSIFALRQLRLSDAEHYARRATGIDPRNTVALVVYARMQQLRGADMEARGTLWAAAEVNPRVVQLLEINGLLRFPALTELVQGEEFFKLLQKAGPATSDELWLRRADEEVGERFRGLALVNNWNRIADGEAGEAETYLRELTDPTAQVDPALRLRAYGQLAILSWQRGDAAQAERYHDLVEEALAEWVNLNTRENYLALAKIFEERGIPLVAVQYPMRRLGPLREMLEPASGVVFVSNERTFKDAMLGRPYSAIFADLFAGDFGHTNVEGNGILAGNVAEAILKLAPAAGGETAGVAAAGEG